MIDVLTYLPARKKTTSSGWISFNAVCCHHTGQSADRRGRGGIKAAEQGWSYHCFNCGFTASFIMGRSLSVKARRLLQWLNVSEEEIERINFESLKHRSVEGMLNNRQRTFNTLADIKFTELDLPHGAEFITPEHVRHYEYLLSRHVPLDYPYMAQIANKTLREGVIVPFTHDNVIVGHTIRFLDERNPRYLNSIQAGYVFGTDLQKPTWKHVIVCEGVFDAMSISGLALLHNTVSDSQARLIRGLGLDITVVPDQDIAGIVLVDRAIELGWAVSIPEWPDDVKDINDAVKKLGRIGTLLTILQNRETSRIKIELRKKQLAKRLQR